jgi:hypothetical protein
MGRGLPDLLLCQDRTRTFAEVKVPGAGLRSNQRAWLKKLKNLEMNCSLVEVEAVSDFTGAGDFPGKNAISK